MVLLKYIYGFLKLRRKVCYRQKNAFFFSQFSHSNISWVLTDCYIITGIPFLFENTFSVKASSKPSPNAIWVREMNRSRLVLLHLVELKARKRSTWWKLRRERDDIKHGRVMRGRNYWARIIEKCSGVLNELQALSGRARLLRLTLAHSERFPTHTQIMV